ncbi:MAG: HYR domain-containing protein, partial [Nitrososphaerales archaeon]
VTVTQNPLIGSYQTSSAQTVLTVTGDTTPPTVVSKTTSDSLISDSDVPGPFTATTTFSEPMSTGATPTITFSTGVSSTLTFTSGAWSVGNTVYTATYAIADGGVTAPSVTFTVSGAADAATNPQVVDTTAMTPFAIDTENPTKSSTVSDSLISDSDVPGPFTVTTTFSETMDTSVAATPVITFAPDVTSTLTFVSGSWNLASTVYTASYTIADAGVTVTGVDVTVSGAKDVAGNLDPGTTFDLFSIDTENPVLTVPADIRQEADTPTSGTVVFLVTATAPSISCTDDALTPNPVSTTGGTFALGITTVSCTATDASGNTASGSFRVTIAEAFITAFPSAKKWDAPFDVSVLVYGFETGGAADSIQIRRSVG